MINILYRAAFLSALAVVLWEVRLIFSAPHILRATLLDAVVLRAPLDHSGLPIRAANDATNVAPDMVYATKALARRLKFRIGRELYYASSN